ncbi:MAG: hypothetical protein MUC88_23580 [Planctomycetes bacterium]|nr:hypothetical protein [Planctomycetota bacterium]
MADLVIGGVPRGDDYFDQRQLLKDVWKHLQKDSVLLVAPRRFGKTGMMFRLLDRPRAGFRPLYLDVESIDNPANFMVEILALLLHDDHFRRAIDGLSAGLKEVWSWLTGLVDQVDVGEIKVKLREKTDVSANWRVYGDRVMGMLATQDRPLLLLVDEFPIMVNRMADKSPEEAVQFLRWFRSVRLMPANRTRFVIGGSTNIMYTLEALGSVDAVNDLCPVRLRPFDATTAERYLAAMFATRHLALDPQVSTRILELIGEPIPYLLALLVQAVLSRSHVRSGPIDIELVNAAFDELLSTGATVFLHYWSRLNEHYPGCESGAAKAILSVVSRAEGPVQRDTLYQVYLQTCAAQPGADARDAFVRLMWKLDNDFYIVADDDGYRFFSRVLKLWWRRHYGYQQEG